jgi:hypothetical protein
MKAFNVCLEGSKTYFGNAGKMLLPVVKYSGHIC